MDKIWRFFVLLVVVFLFIPNVSGAVDTVSREGWFRIDKRKSMDGVTSMGLYRFVQEGRSQIVRDGVTYEQVIQAYGEVDRDFDGYRDDEDNCEFWWNPDQADYDNDGKGDLCDKEDPYKVFVTYTGRGIVDDPENPYRSLVTGISDVFVQGDTVIVMAELREIWATHRIVMEFYNNGEFKWQYPESPQETAFNQVDQNWGWRSHQAFVSYGDIWPGEHEVIWKIDINDGRGYIEFARASFTVFSNDPDGDGVKSVDDNCPNHWNVNQLDENENGVGDVCDLAFHDEDRDGVLDFEDNCPTLANPDQVDSNGNGQGDVCDVSDALVYQQMAFGLDYVVTKHGSAYVPRAQSAFRRGEDIYGVAAATNAEGSVLWKFLIQRNDEEPIESLSGQMEGDTAENTGSYGRVGLVNALPGHYMVTTLADYGDGSGFVEQGVVEFDVREFGRISGTVSGEYTSRAVVRAWSRSLSEEFFATLDANTGEYVLDDLPPVRDYVVCFSDDDVVDGCYSGEGVEGMTSEVEASLLDVRYDDVSNVDFVVETGRMISGHVFAVDVEVGLGYFSDEQMYVNLRSVKSGQGAHTIVGNDGYFEVKGLVPADDYEVSIELGGMLVTISELIDITVGDDTGMQLVAQFGSGSVAGIITGYEEGAVVEVTLRSESRSVVIVDTVIVLDGVAGYVFAKLAPGNDYIVSVKNHRGVFYRTASDMTVNRENAYPVRVEPRGQVDGLNFHFPSVPLYSVGGRVSGIHTVDDQVVTTVTVWSDNGAFGKTTVKGNGDWVIDDLPGGGYNIAFDVPGYYRRRVGTDENGIAYYLTNGHESYLVDSDVVSVNAVMEKGSAVFGRVVDEDGNPVVGVYVNAYQTSDEIVVLDVGDGQVNEYGRVNGGSHTRADGSFLIEGLVPSRVYRVEIVSSFGDGLANVRIEIFDQDLGNMVLRKEDGVIVGRVEGVGSANAMVLAYTDEEPSLFVGATVADENGGFLIRGLSLDPGLYRLDVYVGDDFGTVDTYANVNLAEDESVVLLVMSKEPASADETQPDETQPD